MQTIPGRLVTPVNMASFDTWIKQYRPDENTANMSVNYYPKGAVIAFLLDAKIRKATNGARSLDTGMQWAMQRYSGEKGYTPDQFYAVMSEAAGTDLKGWFAKAAESTDELDYTEALEYYGLRFRPVDMRNARAYIGGGTRNDAGRLVITSVRRGTPGIDAGLNVDDEIIAIDDVRVRADGLAARLDQYKPGDKVSVLVARRDRLMKIDVTLGAGAGPRLAARAAAERDRRADRASECADGRQVTVCNTGASPTFRTAEFRLFEVLMKSSESCSAVAPRLRYSPPHSSAANERRAVVAAVDAVADSRDQPDRARRQAQRRDLAAGAGRSSSSCSAIRPKAAAPTQRTEARIAYDEGALYVAVRAFDTDAATRSSAS